MPAYNNDGNLIQVASRPDPTRFLDCIDNVVFMPDGQGPDRSWTVPAADLGVWFAAYQTCFMETMGAADGRNLHRLYNREVLLSGNGLGENMAEFDELATRVREQRLGLIWNLPLAEFVTLSAELVHRVDGGLLPSISVLVMDDGAQLDRDDCCAAFDSLANASCQLQLVGELKTLEQLGVMDLASINRANITHNPRNLPLLGGLMRSSRIRPCRSRFRLFVGPDGRIYPCVPMIGLPRCALGTIHQPVAEIFAGKGTMLDLDHLAQNGPQLRQPIAGTSETGLPLECELHRETIRREMV